MRGDLSLFKLFGVEVKVHMSWWFIFVLLSWSLASGFFPFFYPQLTSFQYFIMGLSSAFLLFFSVLLHEFSHSLVAKARNIKVESITLFFFGGVSSIEDEKIKPKDEFLMAIAGPLFSLLLAGLFYILFVNVTNIFLNAISFYLYQLNLILAVFNLVPAFPLDGGRAFRAILYNYYGDLKKATGIAATGGKIFAWTLAVLGLLQLFSGAGGGLWLIFLGVFLHFIAGLSYEQVVFREILSKWKVKDLMDKKFTKVDGEKRLSIFLEKNKSNLKEEYLVKKSAKDLDILGIMNLKKTPPMLKAIQERMKIRQLTLPLSDITVLSDNETAYSAFKSFAKDGRTFLPVKSSKGKKIVGILYREKLFNSLLWNSRFKLDFSKSRFSSKLTKRKISRKKDKDIISKSF